MKSLPSPTAANINEAYKLAQASAENAVQHAIRCGQMLAAKKREVGHGNFQTWVEKNCDFAYSTAARYMKASQNSTAVEISSLSRLFPSGQPGTKPKSRRVTPEPEVMNPPESAARGSEAGNLNTAHVMGIGAVHRASEARPAEEAPPSPDFDYEPEEDEDAILEKAEQEYAASIDKVMAADDKLAAANAEIKRQAAEIAALKLSRNGYQNQCQELIRRIKSLQRENDKLKRLAA